MITVRKLLVLAIALVLASSPSAAAVTAGATRGPARTLDACAACKDTGELECKACAKTTCKWEGPGKAQWCTQSVACPDCVGTRRAACTKCERGLPEAAKKLHAEAAAWRAKMQDIDRQVETTAVHAQSPHFRITWSIKQVDAKGGNTPHGGMHVYLDRLEALYADFLRDVGATEKDFLDRTHVMLWQTEKEQAKASILYTGQSSSTESKLMGKSPVVSIFYDKSHLHEEFELHQAMVHQVAHCLLSNVFDGIWPGNIKGGWIDCGLAHAYEIRYFGSVRHYCYVESDTLQTFKFGRWEQAVLSGVQSGKELRFLGVTGRHTTELTPEEHMYAWSYCDYLLRAHAARFGAVVKAVKQRVAAGELLRTVLDTTPAQFQEDWATWVKETYSPKKKGR